MKADFRIILPLTMSSSSEKQIAVALFRRDPISEDPRKRQLYQHEAYHWGILIIDGDEFDAYDATDRNTIDPITFRQENPTQEWWFRAKQGVDPRTSERYLGCTIIGTVPSNKSRDDIRAFLEGIPLPKKNENPQQSCVTWVGSAIRAFQEAQYIKDFDVGAFMDWTLSYADARLKKAEGTPRVVHYEKS